MIACDGCGNEFEARRANQRFCSATCRKRGSRGVGKGEAVSSSLVESVRRDLDQLGKTETVDGQQALVIAQRMVSPHESGAAVSSLSKDLSRIMAGLSRGAEQADPVDEVRRQRERKARQASR